MDILKKTGKSSNLIGYFSNNKIGIVYQDEIFYVVSKMCYFLKHAYKVCLMSTMHINLLIFILSVRMTHHWQQTGLPTYTDIIATATSKTDSLDSKIPTYELLTQFPETLTLTFNSMYQGFQLLLST